jgi:flagellar hook-basal body complex protein FliE
VVFVAVGAIGSFNPAGPAGSGGGPAGAGATGFGAVLNQAIQNLSDSQKKADDAVFQFLTGSDQDPAKVTVAMEEAKVRMELAVEVRNKIVDAYKEIWQMSV